MWIEKKTPNGRLIRCEHGHSFLVRAAAPSVECPTCGRTALMVDLAADYYLERGNAARAANA